MEENKSGSFDKLHQEDDPDVTEAAMILCSMKNAKLDEESAQELKELVVKSLGLLGEAASSTPSNINKSPRYPPFDCLKEFFYYKTWTQPFEKLITPTDVNEKNGRMELSKTFVKNECLKLLNRKEDEKKGIQVIVYGPDGKLFEKEIMFKFFDWGVRKVYFLFKGWNKFYRKYELKAGDWVRVWMFRNKETNRLCFVFTRK